MKNQTYQTWFLRGIRAMAFLMTVGVGNVFADASNCANPWELTLDGNVKMKFCDIPAAKGALIGSENGKDDEKPVKARSFKEFQMAQFEVTQLQYRIVTGTAPWIGHRNGSVREGDNFPAVYVSHADAKSFANVLSWIDKTATYRLPTEAEFEYAARAGTTTHYYWGNEMDALYAYFSGNSGGTGSGYAHEVDSCPNRLLNQKYPGYCSNGFGLYHMLGNLWEWTADAYVNNYVNAPTEGNVAVLGDWDSDRVIRGGSWNTRAQELRSANRAFTAPNNRTTDLGFRIVRIAK